MVREEEPNYIAPAKPLSCRGSGVSSSLGRTVPLLIDLFRI
jgi:hypothetical protein